LSSEVKFTHKDIKMIVGIKGVEILVDGKEQTAIEFGETVTFDVEPGEREIRTILYGVADRESKALKVTAIEGEKVAIKGKYSRLWGNIKLKLL